MKLVTSFHILDREPCYECGSEGMPGVGSLFRLSERMIRRTRCANQRCTSSVKWNHHGMLYGVKRQDGSYVEYAVPKDTETRYVKEGSFRGGIDTRLRVRTKAVIITQTEWDNIKEALE